MPIRNPFEETMRAGVPQRVTRPTMRDVAGPVRENPMEGYRLGDVTVSDLPPRMPTPIQSGRGRGEFSDRLYSGRNPFIQPIQMGGSRGEFSPMSSGQYLASRFGGGLDDAAGMNESARGMLEGAGFDIAGGPGMTDKRMTDKLWGKAVNKFPVGTPDMIIQQEWERLKQIYFDKTYGGGQGLTLPGRDDIVGLS